MNNVLAFAQRGAQPLQLPVFTDTADVVNQLRPSLPTYVIDQAHISATAARFIHAFSGTAMFAVKTNPNEDVLRALVHGGMNTFDVASLGEIELVHKIAPHAKMFFMHTIKAPEAIRAAYFDYGIRDFSLDHEDELSKILECTDNATDLNLYVRIALPKNENAAIDFSSKFGIKPSEAPALIRACRKVSVKLGLCFHVGTQTMDAGAYGNAINVIKNIIHESHVKIDCLDVGGGFPVPYEGENVPSIENCLDVLHTALRHAELDELELFAEPGRCLVALGGSLIVRVELRKGNMLYINDGTYGGLFDAGALLRTPFPVQAHRAGKAFEGVLEAFSMAGPTCDSIDLMEGPFMLPSDIKTGDWIEIKNTGSYSQAMRTDFNGFGACDCVFIG